MRDIVGGIALQSVSKRVTIVEDIPRPLVELIDLDNIRPNLKRQKRDRERLLRSFDSRPDLREKLSHTLAAHS